MQPIFPESHLASVPLSQSQSHSNLYPQLNNSALSHGLSYPQLPSSQTYQHVPVAVSRELDPLKIVGTNQQEYLVPLVLQNPGQQAPINTTPYSSQQGVPVSSDRNLLHRVKKLQPLPNSNSSTMGNQTKPTNFSTSPSKNISEEHMRDVQEAIFKVSMIESEIIQEYSLAKYHKAQDYFRKHSYSHKVKQQDGTIEYEFLKVCGENEEFKHFSIGVFFYLEFMRRMALLFLFLLPFAGWLMYDNYNGTGLLSFPASFSRNLAMFTMGNNTSNTSFSALGQMTADMITTVLVLIFLWHMSSYSSKTLDEYSSDQTILDPEKYAVSVVGFDPNKKNLEEKLRLHFLAHKFHVFECEVIKNYKGKFGQFRDLEQIIEKIHSQQALINQGKGDKQELGKLRQELIKLQKSLVDESVHPEPIAVIIHFQYPSDRRRFIDYAERKHLFDTCNSRCLRSMCCSDVLSPQQLFEQEDVLLIDKQRLSKPEDILWQNLDISFCSKLFRNLVSFFVIVIIVLITSSLIAICTLYVSSTQSCLEYDSATTLQTALASESLLFCYCQEHIADVLSNQTISASCSQLRNSILLTNGMQIGASVISSATNILLALLVEVMVRFTKPDSKSKASKNIFIIIFLATLINSTFIPLLLNSSIFGVRPNDFLHFLNFINFSNVSVFEDFTRKWFAYISPYYVNMFIISLALPWIDLLKVAILQNIKQCRLKGKQNTILQKEMNRSIIDFALDLPISSSALMLNTFICLVYCSSIPILIPLHFLGVSFNYFSKKLQLIRYSRRISQNEQVFEAMLNVLPFGIAIHLAFGMWAYTYEGVFAPSLWESVSLQQLNIFGPNFSRVFQVMPMLCLLGLVLVYIIIDYTLIALFRCICSCLRDKQDPNIKIDLKDSFQTRYKNSNILGSYKMINNPDYKHTANIITGIMKKAAESKVGDMSMESLKETVPQGLREV